MELNGDLALSIYLTSMVDIRLHATDIFASINTTSLFSKLFILSEPPSLPGFILFLTNLVV